jgi:hypothetical protein
MLLSLRSLLYAGSLLGCAVSNACSSVADVDPISLCIGGEAVRTTKPVRHYAVIVCQRIVRVDLVR